MIPFVAAPLAALPIVLAADWEALIKVGIFLVVIGYSLINQIIAAARKAARSAQPGEPRPAAPKPAVPKPERPPRQQQLHDEVEEFLRRAKAQGLPGAPSSAGNKPPPLPNAQRDKINVELSLPPTARKRPKPSVRVLTTATPATVLDEPLTNYASPGHLEDHISSRNLEHRVGSLATHEQQFDAHVGQGFGRTLGSLASQTAEASVVPPTDATGANWEPTAAERFADDLRNPESMRMAMVLNEILMRPEHRWS
jgi:hypothetical protein